MEYKEARKLVKCIEEVAESVGLDFNKAASRLSFLDDSVREKINTAITIFNEFSDKSWSERMTALGYEVVEHKDGKVEASVIL